MIFYFIIFYLRCLFFRFIVCVYKGYVYNFYFSFICNSKKMLRLNLIFRKKNYIIFLCYDEGEEKGVSLDILIERF